MKETVLTSSEIVHIRTNYNNCRCCNTTWSCHLELAPTEITGYFGHTYETLTAKDALKNLPTLPGSARHTQKRVWDLTWIERFAKGRGFTVVILSVFW